MLELRLLNYYVLRAGDPNFFPSDPQHPTDTFLPLAFEHEYLMDTLLALTANTMRVSQPDDQTLVRASHGYIARSIQKQRRAVGCDLQLKDFEAVYINSLLIAAHTLLQHQFVPLEKDDGQDLQQWFQVLRGLRAITAASSKSFGESRLAIALPIGRWQDPMRTQLETWPSVITGGLFEVLTAGLSSLHPGLNLDQYLPVISYLSLVSRLPSRPMLIGFLFHADPVFVALLSQGDSVARLMLGIYFAIWGAVNVNPWLDPAAERDLRLIFLLLPKSEAQLLLECIQTTKTRGQ